MKSKNEIFDEIERKENRQYYYGAAFILALVLIIGVTTFPVKQETEEVKVIEYIGHSENNPKYQVTIELKSGRTRMIKVPNHIQAKRGSKLLVEKRTTIIGISKYIALKVVD